MDRTVSDNLLFFVLLPANHHIQISILDVTFPENSSNQFTVELHLANPGAPSTIKNGVLIVSVRDKILEQFPPREFNTGPTLGPDLRSIQRGPYLSTEPLLQGHEIKASITYVLSENAKALFGKPGTIFRLTAEDIDGREISAEYTNK